MLRLVDYLTTLFVPEAASRDMIRADGPEKDLERNSRGPIAVFTRNLPGTGVSRENHQRCAKYAPPEHRT